MPDPDFWQPFYLSSIAGASTCVGAAVVFLFPPSKHDNSREVPPGMMSFSLALAGSVMVTVSLISILPECLMETSEDALKLIPITSWKMLSRVTFLCLGGALYFALSHFLVAEPEELLQSESFRNALVGKIESQIGEENASVLSFKNCETESFLGGEEPSTDTPVRGRKISIEMSKLSGQNSPTNNGKCKSILSPNSPSRSHILSSWTSGKDLQSEEKRKAWRVAMLLFISLLVHNFPEGLAVAASAMESQSLGITVTIGIMIHNIPEGIAIAVPCLAARPDQPWLSFVLASVSGLAEPMGALVALIFLRGLDDASDAILSLDNILAFVAGIMMTVSIWELFPEAKRHSTDTRVYFWSGTIVGIVIMTLTELYV